VLLEVVEEGNVGPDVVLPLHVRAPSYSVAGQVVFRETTDGTESGHVLERLLSLRLRRFS